MRNLVSSFVLAAISVVSAQSFARGGRGPERCRLMAGPRVEALVNDRLLSAAAGSLGYDKGLVAFFADDVILLAPLQPIIRGKAAAKAYYDSIDPSGTQRLTWTPSRIDASADDRMETSWGATTTTILADDGTTTTKLGKNIIVWRRDPGRPWRIAAYLQSNASVLTGASPAGFGLFPDDLVRCTAPVDPEAERQVLEQTDDAFAAESVAQNLAIAFRDFAAPDGALRSGADIIVGPDAIYAAGAPFVDPDEVIDWSASDADVAGSDDLGWTVGLIVDDVRDPGTPEDIGFSKYLTLWKKQPDGNWRYVMDGSNIAPAPAP